MTSKARWLSIRETVFKEQRGRCTRCGLSFASHEDMHAHHACYPKDIKFSKCLDSEQNIVLLCNKCHEHIHRVLGNSDFIRDMFWSKKIDNGYDMIEWEKNITRNDGQPMLIHHNFIYIGKDK
jgi:ribosomal protein S27AE